MANLEDDLEAFTGYPDPEKIIIIEYQPTQEEFNHKVKEQAGYLHGELQDVAAKLFNSVVWQTEKGRNVSRRLMTALADLTEIVEDYAKV